jgi:hypothetical protein
LHALPWQVYGAQLVVPFAVHAPTPLQIIPVTTLPAQDVGPHEMPFA